MQHPVGKVSEPLTDTKARVFIIHTSMNPRKADAWKGMTDTSTQQRLTLHGDDALPKKANQQWREEMEFIAECATNALSTKQAVYMMHWADSSAHRDCACVKFEGAAWRS